MRNRYWVLGITGILVVAGCGKPAGADAKADATVKVSRQDLSVKVVETGTVDAVKSVEVKSRVSGRLKKLLVEEGDHVKAGQLIAVIDPKETELAVRQQEAQLRGAVSQVKRTGIEAAQRRQSAVADYRQAQIRVEQLELEMKAQPALTQSNIRSAKANLDAAKQEIQRLKDTAQPNSRTANMVAMNEAKANYDNAKSEYDRQSSLLQQGYVAQKVVENARLSLELARVRLQQAKENNDRIDSQLNSEMQKANETLRGTQAEYDRAVANTFADKSKRQDYETAVAALAKARTALRDVEVMDQNKIQAESSAQQLAVAVEDGQRNLQETNIVAPMDGIVTKKEVQEGELVASLSGFNAGTAIVRIEDRAAMRVTLNINEIDTARLKVGMKADVAVEAIPDRIMTGTVKKIAPAGNNMTGVTSTTAAGDNVVRYQVEIWLDGSDPDLRSGMTAKCTLIAASRTKALSAPTEFVSTDEKGSFVMLAQPKKDGKAQPAIKTYVKVGLKTGAMIEILSGVNEGVELEKPPFSGPDRKGFMQGGPD